MSKTEYYVIRVDVQKRGNPYVHSFIWIFNALNNQNETVYTEFVVKTINSQLPDHLNDPEFPKLVKTYQVHGYSITCLKYNNNGLCFLYGRFLL